MSDDVLKALRVTLGDGEPLVLVVVPPDRLNQLIPEIPFDSGFAPDLSVDGYQTKYEPDLSLGRIRELCALGAFPDTVDDLGEIIPGVYKTASGEWRITPPGILARQRQERSDGMQRRNRDAELRKAKRQAQDAEDADSGGDGQTPAAEAERHDPRPPDGENQSVDRPGKGRWREVLEETSAR